MLPLSLREHILNLKIAMLTIVPLPNIALWVGSWRYFQLENWVWLQLTIQKNPKHLKTSLTDLAVSTAPYRILIEESWLSCSLSATFLKAQFTLYTKNCPASGPHTQCSTATTATSEILSRQKWSTHKHWQSNKLQRQPEWKELVIAYQPD